MTPNLRRRRLALCSGLLATMIVLGLPFLVPPPPLLDEDAGWAAWMERYGPPAPLPPVEQLGIQRFLQQVMQDNVAQGLVVYDEYTGVPESLAVGTKSNLSSQDFPTLVIGRAFNSIDLPASSIVPRERNMTQQGMEEEQGAAFNPAILKMPQGVAKGWEYIVLARGPTVVRKDLWVPESNRYALEHGLIAFPVSLSASNKFIPSLSAARPKFLQIPTKRNNTSCGYWTFPFGAEDPRLYWTDEGRPMMTLSINAGDESRRCRSVAVVQDLRDLWDGLAVAMSGVGQTVARPWSPSREDDSKGSEHQEGIVKELLLDQGMSNVEKNWMGFFPGPKRDGSSSSSTSSSSSSTPSMPYYHYSLIPARVLVPPPPDHASNTMNPGDSDVDSITYSFLPAPSAPDSNEFNRDCISRRFAEEIPDMRRIHQATPLYRYTLCARLERTCVPDERNTVMLGLGQVKYVHPGGQRYGRFFVLWNVTAPFRYVAVGPMIRWYGTPDAEIVYAMSLVFNPPSNPESFPSTITSPKMSSPWQAAIRHRANVQSLRLYGPTHGFVDDDVHVTLGLRDSEMGSVVMRGWDVLLGMKMCGSEV